jgi:hypothetical protein
VRSNAERTLYCPSKRGRVDLLKARNVPQEPGQILEIAIKSENPIDRALDGYPRFDDIFAR